MKKIILMFVWTSEKRCCIFIVTFQIWVISKLLKHLDPWANNMLVTNNLIKRISVS